MTTEMTKLVSKQPLEVTTLPSHMCVYIFILSMKVDKTQILFFFLPYPKTRARTLAAINLMLLPIQKRP